VTHKTHDLIGRQAKRASKQASKQARKDSCSTKVELHGSIGINPWLIIAVDQNLRMQKILSSTGSETHMEVNRRKRKLTTSDMETSLAE
jgi:hypothetical protein